ncbi:MAG: amidohydrolase [Flavobacteriaceae bacterium]|nr:amidohydrolase [Flavobacteriaceae bacterium]
MKKISILMLLASLISCNKKVMVDLIVTNAQIYTVDENFNSAESFAVKDGKFIAVGSSVDILSKYDAENIINAEGKTIVPGLIDAHCHFYGLGLQQQKVDLTGTASFDEVIERIIAFQQEKNVSYITGRGWDQNDWELKEFPTKERLDELFPTTPIAITRIDGHALLANQAAIDLAGVTVNTPESGGFIIKKNGNLTGVFIDNPMELIEAKIPLNTKQEQINALINAEKICFQNGLTTVVDAGLNRDVIELMDEMHQKNQLKIRIDAMVSATEKNLEYYINKGIIKTEKLHVHSFKYYADGALGSRGACLKESYSDKKNYFGALVNTLENFHKTADKIFKSAYQMNTHAIGDSANYVVLKKYSELLNNSKERRWRVEHAQVVDLKDFNYFKNIIPSVQPTHATSDMYWAKDRLGVHRIKGAYAYKNLLKQYGKIPLGTDFPIEQVNPLLTFYAAVVRKDLNNYPENGFQTENALSREEALRGMTIWAAYASFEENEKGSIEAGKVADFVFLDADLMKIVDTGIPKIKVLQTFVGGQKVF